LDKPRLPLDHTQFRRPLEAGGQPDLFDSAPEQPAMRQVAEEPAKFRDDK
jgi:hypothetical protein